jgi:hypothetical protein
MIKNFQHFYENNILNESLNTAVEFDLTDDTQLPNRIYGIFTLDDTQYGMSLEKSDHQGIYLLSMYRVLAKKPRKWSFKVPAHIRPSLSTLLKFIELCVPLVKSQLKGIICQVGGQNMDRYIRFADRILKKSYISTFKVLPTTKSPDYKIYPWENLFIARVGISPSTIFSDPKFKSYVFPQEGVLTHEISSQIKPKLTEKKTLKTEPSTKYAVGKLEVPEITIDSEVLDKVSSLEKVKKTSSKDEENAKKEKVENNKIEKLKTFSNISGKLLSDYNQKMINVVAYWNSSLQNKQRTNVKKFFSETNKNPDLLVAYMIRKYKTSYPKITIEEVGDVLDQVMVEYELTAHAQYLNLLYKDSSGKYTKEFHEIVSKALKKEKKLTDANYSKFGILTSNYADVHSTYYFKKHTSDYLDKNVDETSEVKNKVVLETNLKPENLVSTIEGQGDFDYGETDGYNVISGYNVKNADVSKVVKHLEHNLGYSKYLDGHKHIEDIQSYTSSGYRKMNESLRKSFSHFMNPNESELYGSYDVLKYNKVKNIMSVFDEIKPLEDSLWVYRNTDLPADVKKIIDAGGDFVDPAMLSTTLKHTMNFASGSASRFRIFLPKGSKVIPILNNSAHDNENEIILPAFSVLKIIRVDKYANSPSILVTAVFVGSMYNDFVTKFKEMKSTMKESKNTLITKKEKEKEYDPQDKFALKTDASILKAAQEFIKKLKIKK